MTQRRALIVTIEGLGTNLVGCYGGAMVPTKHFDQFSSRSFVWDQCWADSGLPMETLRSMWFGTHALERTNKPEASSFETVNLLEAALLVTDALEALADLETDLFGEVVLVEATTEGELDLESELDHSSDEQEPDEVSTQVQRLFEAAIGKWSGVWDQYPILWIHSKGLLGVWDAPYEYRKVMCDEGDPDPPTSMEPAVLSVSDSTDPDEVFGLTCAIGGQALAIDQAWGLLISTLDELGIGDECLQILCGVNGYPAGEHGWVGFGPHALYAETIHLPLIVRPGNQLMLGARVANLTHPYLLMSSVADWLRGKDLSATPGEESMNVALSVGERQVHLVVPGWSSRWSTDDESTEAIELFAMPDDRWQQNEVSARAPNIVDRMQSLRNSIAHDASEDRLVKRLATLDQELTKPIR